MNGPVEMPRDPVEIPPGNIISSASLAVSVNWMMPGVQMGTYSQKMRRTRMLGCADPPTGSIPQYAVAENQCHISTWA